MQVSDSDIVTLERNQELINGAEVLAAGRMLGLSDEETIATKMQTRRREQRRRFEEKGSREKNRGAAEEFLRRDEREFEAKGNYKSKIDDVAFAFGEDPEYICLLYTSPSPRDGLLSRMPSSA